MLVRDVMTRTVVTLSPHATLKTAARLLTDHAITSLPVVDDAGSLVGVVTDLEKTSKEENAKLDEEFKDVKPPFVGKRWFVTDRAGSGSGTPQYYLKINENNYAFCGFVQTNQADGTVTEEEIALGKFRKAFDCNFKNELGGNHSYQIEGNYIYELDKNKKIIRSSKAEFVE
jgi:hypothetical protein